MTFFQFQSAAWDTSIKAKSWKFASISDQRPKDRCDGAVFMHLDSTMTQPNWRIGVSWGGSTVFGPSSSYNMFPSVFSYFNSNELPFHWNYYCPPVYGASKEMGYCRLLSSLIFLFSTRSFLKLYLCVLSRSIVFISAPLDNVQLCKCTRSWYFIWYKLRGHNLHFKYLVL